MTRRPAVDSVRSLVRLNFLRFPGLVSQAVELEKASLTVVDDLFILASKTS